MPNTINDKKSDYSIVKLNNGKFAAQYKDTNELLDCLCPTLRWTIGSWETSTCKDTVDEVLESLDKMIVENKKKLAKQPLTISKKIFPKKILRKNKLERILVDKPKIKKKSKKELAQEWKNSLSEKEKEFLKILTRRLF